MRENVELLMQQGMRFLDLGDTQNAAETFRQATVLAPTDSKAFFYYGVSLLEQGKLEEAAQAFETSTRLDPTSAPAWHNLGYSYYRLGFIEKAIESFQRSIAIQADKWDSHLLLGLCYLQTAKLEQSAESLEKALEYGGELVPRSSVYSTLASVYDILGQHQKSGYYANLIQQSMQRDTMMVSSLSLIEHFVCFSEYENAVRALDAYRAEGLEAELLSGPDDVGSGYCIMIRDTTPVESELFDQFVKRLERIAAEYGGEYDGWGQDV